MRFGNHEEEIKTLWDMVRTLEQQVAEQRAASVASRKDIEVQSEQDRLRQSGTEYWKATYEQFKHVTTIALASLAAFAALLGGFLQDVPAGEGGMFGLLEASQNADWGTQRNYYAAAAFTGFLLATLFAVKGMNQTILALWEMRRVRSEGDFDNLRRQSGYRRTWKWLSLFYIIGLTSVLVVVLSSISI